MKISIIICTRNRASSLSQTLDAMQQLEVPRGLQPEIIVVDNASNDDTAQVVATSDKGRVPVSYLYEGQGGKGFAYNAGIIHAQGEIILFTDDDVHPSSNWIAQMCEPIISNTADAVGGAIEMATHLRRSWMEQLHYTVLADNKLSGVVARSNEMIGANMAFSRRVLSQVPEFDTELGPGALGFLDDSLFALQLAEAGYRIAFNAEAVVTHFFQETRLSAASFASRMRKEGHSAAYVAYHWRHQTYPHPALRLYHFKLRLSRMRRSRCKIWPYSEGLPIAEMQTEFHAGLMEQMLIEKKRPYNYEKHGLVKLKNSKISVQKQSS